MRPGRAITVQRDRTHPAVWFDGLLALVVLAGLLAAMPTIAAIHGSPLETRFTPRDYRGSGALAAIQVHDGAVYVASGDGVLKYDGFSWETVPLPGGLAATALGVGEDGRLYVGGQDALYRLSHDADGGAVFEDLLPALNTNGHAVGALGLVWDILPSPEGLFVHAEQGIHFLPSDEAGAKFFVALPDEARGVSLLGNELVLRVHGQGLMRLEDRQWVPVTGGDVFKETPLAGTVSHLGRRWLVAANGIWEASSTGMSLRMPWPATLPGIYGVLPLPEGGFVATTLEGQLLHVGADLTLRQQMPLSSQSLLDASLDDEGVLWAITETEVLRLDFPSGWSLLTPQQGLRGVVYDTEWHAGALWIATSNGLGRLPDDPVRVQPMQWLPWVPMEAYALWSRGQDLLIGHRDGLLQVRGAAAPQVLAKGEVRGIRRFIASAGDSNLLYAIGFFEIALLRAEAEGYRVVGRVPLDDLRVLDAVERAPGELWIAPEQGELQRWVWDLNAGTRIEHAEVGVDLGLPESGGEHPTRLVSIDRRLLVLRGANAWALDSATGRFQFTPLPWLRALSSPHQLQLMESVDGDIVATGAEVWMRPSGHDAFRPVLEVNRTSRGFGLPRRNRDGVIRLPVWNGVLQFQPGYLGRPEAELQVGFSRLRVRADDGTWQSQPLDAAVLRMVAGQPLQLRFGLATLESGGEFRYRLSGVVPEFSDWSDRDLGIRGLDPGQYRFDVEARLPSGRLIAPRSLILDVQPLWHQQRWVRALLALLALVLAFVSIRALMRWRMRRVEQRNVQLEQRIAERTADLEDLNKRLADMAIEDPLTGIANRRALEQAISREWARCADQRLPLAALMIDVDHFKRFNDQRGHLEGDRCLIEVAKLLSADLAPPLEILARYGGEEFTLLLPGSRLETALARAEQLRARVAADPLGVTVSIGVAAVWPLAEDNYARLLIAADQALYSAKHHGRNRVEAAED